MEKAVAKVAEKLVVVAIKLAAIVSVDPAMAIVLADRVMEMATVLVDHVPLAKAMATARSVVIADRAKAVVAARASVVQVVVDLLKVS